MEVKIISFGEDWKWEDIESITGYKPKTTFWQDFSIAEIWGEQGIRDTYKRAFHEWCDNVEFMTELTMVLNWKMWDWFKKNQEITDLYGELWTKNHHWCLDNLKGEDLSYYLSTTD